jgi:hypothetical protein
VFDEVARVLALEEQASVGSQQVALL